ncbi:MAG TPA: hypothetical protein VGK63_01045, partial [Candidatus Limnocylindrales bacterium]
RLDAGFDRFRRLYGALAPLFAPDTERGAVREPAAAMVAPSDGQLPGVISEPPVAGAGIVAP